MVRYLSHALLAATAALLWASLAYLIFWDDVGRRDAFDARSIIASALLVAAPAVTFVPLARWLQAPLYDIEGTLGWAALGFLVAFVRPYEPLVLWQFVAFLIALTVALATALALAAHLVGARVALTRGARPDFLRARRQGYIGSFFLSSVLVLWSVGTLTYISAAMLLTLVVLGEMLAQAHTGRALLRAGLGPRRARVR